MKKFKNLNVIEMKEIYYPANNKNSFNLFHGHTNNHWLQKKVLKLFLAKRIIVIADYFKQCTSSKLCKLRWVPKITLSWKNKYRFEYYIQESFFRACKEEFSSMLHKRFEVKNKWTWKWNQKLQYCIFCLYFILFSIRNYMW